MMPSMHNTKQRIMKLGIDTKSEEAIQVLVDDTIHHCLLLRSCEDWIDLL